MKRQSRLVWLLLLLGGCIGGVRDSTTERTAQEQLLLSTAHQRALARLDLSPLAGQRVFVDTRYLEVVDRGYVESAFFEALAEAGALLVRALEDADVVFELRAAAGALWQGDWIIGIPIPYPDYYVPEEHLESVPFLIQIGYSLREGWARLDGFAYERATGAHVFSLREGWGRSHVGFTENIYPPATILDTLREKLE